MKVSKKKKSGEMVEAEEMLKLVIWQEGRKQNNAKVLYFTVQKKEV